MLWFSYQEIISASHDSYTSTISSYVGFPHSASRPNLSNLLDTSLILQLVWFHTFSLIPQNHPDLKLEHYLFWWLPLFRVMIKSLLLVTHSHPLASWDYLAHTCPSGKGLLRRCCLAAPWSIYSLSDLDPCFGFISPVVWGPSCNSILTHLFGCYLHKSTLHVEWVRYAYA